MLTEPHGAVFEGEFHNNKKHGEGVQMYRYVFCIVCGVLTLEVWFQFYCVLRRRMGGR